MTTNMELMKKINEEKRQKTKQQDKLKRPDKQIGEARKRIKRHKVADYSINNLVAPNFN